MTVSTRGQTVEPPDGDNNTVPIHTAGRQNETPQSVPTDPSDNETLGAPVVAPQPHSNSCNDANCSCSEPDFPHLKLATLDEKISSPRWVVPVLPEQELECLIQAAIDLSRTGDDVRSEACQRFFREGLTISFTKILTDEAVNSWKYNIHYCIYQNCLRLIELCVVKLPFDWFPLLDLLAMVLNPNNRFHTFNASRQSETVPPNTNIADEDIFARPPDTRTPRGWLVDLINKFGSLGGFQILVERFQSGKNLTVSVIYALIRPFGLCAELLTVHTIVKYLMPIVEKVPQLLNNLTDEELKKEAKNESKNDAISSIIKAAKCLVSRVSGLEENVKQLEIFRLKMILRLLQISSFNGKMNALNEVNKVITTVSYYPHRHAAGIDPDGEWLTPERMAKWIKDNGVLQIVLRDSLHQPQYVEKLEKILRFVIKEKCLTLEDLDSVWAAQHGKHEAIVKNVHDLLAKLAWDFSPEQLDHLFECFQASWTNANKKQREKLLELIRRLAEDDKDGVMAHKVLTLFWNLAHSEDVINEIMDQALNAHVKILDYSCSQERDAQKTEWLNRCVEELKSSDNWVLPALKQIREIACLYEQSPSANQRGHQNFRQEVINRLQQEHQLVVLVTNNLTSYMDKVRYIVRDNPDLDPSDYCPDNRYNHVMQVQERLNFLRFLLKDGQLWLCEEQAKQIWQCLAEGAVFITDREACFKWFSKLMGDDPDLDPHINKDFFQNHVLQLDPALLTESGMKCFERFFKAVNKKEKKLKNKKRSVMLEDVDLIGNEYIWRVVTSSSDEMAAKAIQLLKEVSTNLGPRLQISCVQFHQSFTSECLDRLRAHYDTVCALQSSSPDPPGRLQLECVKMCRVLKVLQEYVSEYDGEFGGERKSLPLYRACRGKQLSLVVRFTHPGRLMDDMEIQTHTNETLGSTRRYLLKRLKAVSAQHIKLDLYFNGDLLDPADDRKLLSEFPLSGKVVLTGKLSQANANIGSSPDSSSDSSTSSPQHAYDNPSVEAENSLPGVILSQQPNTAECLLRVCELGCSLGDAALSQAAYSVLNMCPPDAHVLNKLYSLFAEIEDPMPEDSELPRLPSMQSIFYNTSSTHVLYNLEVLYSLLMPANDPLSDKAFEMQYNFLKSPHAEVFLEMLAKPDFMAAADLSTRRYGYLTVLKICKFLLCVIAHITSLYHMFCHTPQKQRFLNAAELGKDDICALSIPNEQVLETVAFKLAKCYIEQMGPENKWSKWLPSEELVQSTMLLIWASVSANINHTDLQLIHDAVPTANPHPSDVYVCKEALEVLAIALILNPNALKSFDHWNTFIIDIVLVCSNRSIRGVAAEQLLAICHVKKICSTCRDPKKPLQFSISLLFSVLHSLVMEYSKNSQEFFQLLSSLLNLAARCNCTIPELESLLFSEIVWLKNINIAVKEHGETGVYEAVLDGHLSIAKELISFLPPEKKFMIGSDENSEIEISPGRKVKINLIKELVEDFIFPASKLMVHLQKTGELIGEQAVAVCSSPISLNSAFELLVTLCDGCVPNMRLLVSMLSDLFYSDDSEGLQEWDYLPPVGPRPNNGFVGLKNAGATCYMNSVLQQLYMVPSIREGILAAEGATSDADEFFNDSDSVSSNSEVDEKASSDESRKEYNIGILKQVQAIFGHLAFSKLQYYVPKGLWRHFKLQGEPVNLREQQDAVEFFMSLIESIDEALKALGQEQIMSIILGGSYSDQKICKGCPHRYSKEEPFSVISVDIRNQSTLQDSLEQYVKGELLEGADAYHCDKCNKKVSTVKRLCVKKLPPVLTIQLKRFEYDFEKVCAIKFNDYFEFPRQLDMEPYTVSGLAKLEGEVDCEYAMGQKDVCTKYQLTGIIIHSGQASGGHYNSFIKQRFGDGTSKWYKFDDGEVTECKMDDDEEMKVQCFGGDYMGEVYDHMIKRTTYRRQKRWWNAYMLYYTRQDIIESECSLVKQMNNVSISESPRRKLNQLKIPPAIERSVRRQNISFVHTRNQFSAEYFQFMRRLASVNIPAPSKQHNADKANPDAEELSLLSVQIASRFLFHTGFRTKKCLRGQATDWYDVLSYHLKMYPSVRSWFAHNALFKHPNRFCEYLLSCPSGEVRTSFMKILVFLAHFSLHDGPCPPPMLNAPTIHLDRKATLSDHLLVAVLNMLHKEISEYGRHLPHYFALFHTYAAQGVLEKAQLLNLNVPGMFMCVALDEGPGPAIKYQYAELTKLHCVVSQLIRCCDITHKQSSSQQGQRPLPNPYEEPSGPIMVIQPQAEEILFGRSNYVKKIIEDCQATEDGAKLLQYCSWENPQFSRTVLSELLWQIAFAYCHDLRHHIDLLLAVVPMEDSWQTYRLHNALKGVPEERDGLFDIILRYKNHHQKRAYQCIKCLVALFTQCLTALQLLHNNPEFRSKWTSAVDWLHDELERRPYGSNTQYAFNNWSPPTQSNDSSSSFFLERSSSARKTLEKAIEFCPEEEPEVDDGCEDSENSAAEEVKPGPSNSSAPRRRNRDSGSGVEGEWRHSRTGSGVDMVWRSGEDESGVEGSGPEALEPGQGGLAPLAPLVPLAPQAPGDPAPDPLLGPPPASSPASVSTGTSTSSGTQLPASSPSLTELNSKLP